MVYHYSLKEIASLSVYFTCKVLSVRSFFMKLDKLPLQIMFDNVFRIRGLHGVSYALEMSRATRPFYW